MNEPLHEWLARLCLELEGSSAGLLVLGKPEGPFEPAASWPECGVPNASVLGAVRAALGSHRPVIQTGGAEAEGGSGRDVLAVPFQIAGGPSEEVRGALAVEVPHRAVNAQQPGIERLQDALSALPVSHAALPAPAPALLNDTRPPPQDPLLELVARTLSAESTQRSARAAAEGVARWLGAVRVGVGFCKGTGELRLAALSDSERFDPRVEWVRKREAAMLEAFDQDAAVSHPPRGSVGLVVSAHAELAGGRDGVAVHTVLLRSGGVAGSVIGALTAEFEPIRGGDRESSASMTGPHSTRGPDVASRKPDTVEAGAGALASHPARGPGLRRSAPSASDASTLASLERVAALLGPALAARRQASRGVLRHVSDAARERLEIFLGPGHLRTKALAAGALLAVVLLAVLPGTFRVSASARVQGSVQRAVVAPVDGYVAESRARAGDLVESGDLLGLLDSTDLDLERRKWLGARAQLTKAMRAAMALGDRAELTILRARLEQAEAELALVEEQRARTRLLAPFDGVVARGDLSQRLGSPVERGEVLFEVAPLEAFRVDVEVDERDVAHVVVGQPGRLILAALPGEPLSFRVVRIAPVATTDADGSTFRVEAALEAPAPGLRPGMEGVARVEVGRRSLLWIWTRRIVEWVDLVAWSWLP